MSLTVEVWRPWEAITVNRSVQSTDKSFLRWLTGKCFLYKHHHSEGSQQSVGPEPTSLKSLSWYLKTGEKRLLLSKVFLFCHKLQYNSFQVPRYKILEIFLSGSDDKLYSVGQPDFSPPPSPRICLSLRALVWNSLLWWVAFISPLLRGESWSPGHWHTLYYQNALADTRQGLSYHHSKRAFQILGTRNLPKRSHLQILRPPLPIRVTQIYFNNMHAIFPLSHLKPST